MFAQDLGAMATLRILELESGAVRSMESKFGVVPMPKYDEKQEGYYTLCHNEFTTLCVPSTSTVEQLDEVSAVLEALGSASYRIVRPAYYETTLRTKIAQDPQSAAMMDMIVDGIKMDPGVLYCIGDIHGIFRYIVESGVNDIASHYAKVERYLKRDLPVLNQKLTEQAEREWDE